MSFFSLVNCQIHGNIPPFFNLSSLQYLVLTGNHLEGVVPDLSKCAGMKQVMLGENSFSSFDNPSMFASMPELATLHLNNLSMQGVDFGTLALPSALASLR